MKVTITNRVVQYVFAIVSLILAAILVKDKSSMSTIVGDVNDLLSGNATTSDYLNLGEDLLNLTKSTRSLSEDVSESLQVRRSADEVGASADSIVEDVLEKRDLSSLYSNISLDGNIKPIAIALGSGSLTTFGHGALYLFNRLKLKGSALKISDVNSKMLGLSKSQASYLTSLASSELGGIVLWFMSFVYQTSVSGGWDCSDPASLLKNYNLTGVDEDSSVLSNFFNIGSDSSASNSSISNLLSSYKDDSSSTANLTNLESQTKLLLNLSSNCKTRKASIAISCIGMLTYFFSSAVLTSSGIMLFTNLRKLKAGQSSGESTDGALDYSFHFSDPLLFPVLKSKASTQSEDEEEKEKEKEVKKEEV